MNKLAKEMLASMQEAANESRAKQKRTQGEAVYTRYLAVRDHLNANLRERAGMLGVDFDSEEFKITWALAAFTADEHLQGYTELVKGLTGFPADDFLSPGIMAHSLYEVLQS